MKPKPHRRLPKPRRNAPVVHPTGLSRELLSWRNGKPRPPGAVTAEELERDVIAFLGVHYADRHLDIETAQLGLSNVAQRLVFLSLKSVAG